MHGYSATALAPTNVLEGDSDFSLTRFASAAKIIALQAEKNPMA